MASSKSEQLQKRLEVNPIDGRLDVNVEAIYDIHNWIKFREDGQSKICFTIKGDALYAIIPDKLTLINYLMMIMD